MLGELPPSEVYDEVVGKEIHFDPKEGSFVSYCRNCGLALGGGDYCPRCYKRFDGKPKKGALHEERFHNISPSWERLQEMDRGIINGDPNIGHFNQKFAQFLKMMEVISGHLSYNPEVVLHCKEIGKRFIRNIGNIQSLDSTAGYESSAKILTFLLGEAWNDPYAQRIRSMRREFCELFDIKDLDFWRLRQKLATWVMENVRGMEARMWAVLNTGHF